MPLTPGTDTYATEAELAAYALARGVTLIKDQSVLLTLAMDYLEGLDGRWQGLRTTELQPLAWPRQKVYVDGVLISDSVVPAAIKNAQMQLAIYADTIDLNPIIGVNAAGAVTSKSVGDVSVGYGAGTNNKAPLFPAVMRGLAAYLGAMGGSNFNVSRI
jgi:hypothetical protein